MIQVSELKKETLKQLQKDFGAHWIEESDESSEFVHLYTKTFRILKNIQFKSEFMNVLYRIDIPEADYKASMKSIEPLEILSELIIKREFIKVLLRKNIGIKDIEGYFRALKS